MGQSREMGFDQVGIFGHHHDLKRPVLLSHLVACKKTIVVVEIFLRMVNGLFLLHDLGIVP